MGQSLGVGCGGSRLQPGSSSSTRAALAGTPSLCFLRVLWASRFKAVIWVISPCRCITHVLGHIKAYLPLLCPITWKISFHEEALWRKSFTKYRNVNCAFISIHCEISFCETPQVVWTCSLGYLLEEGPEPQFLKHKHAQRTCNGFSSYWSLAVLQVCFIPSR